MNQDPELEHLKEQWKECDMSTLQLNCTPRRMSHESRWEARIGLPVAALLGGVAIVWGATSALSGAHAEALFAGVLGALAVALGRGLLALRRRAQAADALLRGTPLEVAQGHRALLHTRLCAIRSPTAITLGLLPLVLALGMALRGEAPVDLSGAIVAAYAVWMVWAQLRTVPALRKEIGRLDRLIVELGP